MACWRWQRPRRKRFDTRRACLGIDDRRELIYRDDTDRHTHIGVIAKAMDRFDAQVLA